MPTPPARGLPGSLPRPAALAAALAIGLAPSACGPVPGSDDDAASDDDGAPDDDAADDDAADDDTTPDDDATSDDDTGGDDDDATPPDEIPPPALATDAPDGVAVTGLDLAVAPDGEVFASWVDDRDGSLRVRVARSRDFGASFEPSVAATAAGEDPMVAAARRPYVVADAERVAVVFTDRELTGVSAAWAQRGDLLDFQPSMPMDVGAAEGVDFARGAIGPNLELWVTWQGWDAEGHRWIAFGHEYDGFRAGEADDIAPGDPCPCCPLDTAFDSMGTLLVAWRNNDEDLREQWVVLNEACGLDFAVAAQASHTGWVTESCPMDGPRLAERADGALLLTWADSSTGEGRIWMASSADGGASWSGDHGVAETGETQSNARVAVGPTGRIWVALTSGAEEVLTSSEDGGATFASPAAVFAGEARLSDMEVRAGGGVVLVAGYSEDGAGWVARVE